MLKKIKNLIKKQRNLYKKYTRIRNYMSCKNKLRPNGCKVSLGDSVVDGLKIVSNGSDNEVIIGDCVRIYDSSVVLYGSHNRIVINDNASLNQVELFAEDSHNEIVVGSGTKFCGKAHLAVIEGTKILIGDNCLLSSDLHFRTGDSHSILNMHGERINESKDIVIDNHVWIGTKVTCLKGVCF